MSDYLFWKQFYSTLDKPTPDNRKIDNFKTKSTKYKNNKLMQKRHLVNIDFGAKQILLLS